MPSAGRSTEGWEHSSTADGNVKQCCHSGERVALSLQVRYTASTWPSHCTPWRLPQEGREACARRLARQHSWQLYSKQLPQPTCPPTIEETCCAGTSWGADTHCGITQPPKHHAAAKNPDTEDCGLHNSFRVKFVEKAKLGWRWADQWLLSWKEGGQGRGWTFWRDGNVLYFIL